MNTGRRRLKYLSIAAATSMFVGTSLPPAAFASPQTEPLLKAIDPSEAKLDTPVAPANQYPGQSGPNPFGRVSGAPVSPGGAAQPQQGTDNGGGMPDQSQNYAPQYPSESQIPQFGQPLPPSAQGGGGNAQNWATDQSAPPAQAPPTLDEMRITRLEKQAFGSTYPEHEVEDRVDHLEKEIFGSKSTAPMADRIAKLETKLGGPGVFGQSPSAQSLAQRSVPTQAASNMYPTGGAGTSLAGWNAGPAAPNANTAGPASSTTPPQVAYAPPSKSNVSAPPQSSYSAPAQSGYSQPAESGYSQPAQGGYSQPVQGGYSQPAESGYLQPAQGGYSAPPQSGYLQPAQSGYLQPAQGGYSAPPQGYNAQPQGGYSAPPQSYAPPQTAYAPPMVPGQGGYPVPQGGYAPQGQNPYMAQPQGYPQGYGQPPGYPAPAQAYGAAPQMAYGWPAQPQYQQPPGYGGWPQQPQYMPPPSYNPAGRGFPPAAQTAYAGPPGAWGAPQTPYTPPQQGYQPMPGSGVQPAYSSLSSPQSKQPQPAASSGPLAPSAPNPCLNSTDYLTVIKGIPSDPKAGDYFGQLWRPNSTTCARWTRLPIKVHLPPATPESWQKNLDAAVKKWGQYLPLKVAGPSEAADVEVVWESHFPQKIFGVTRLQVLQGHPQVQIYLLRPTFYPPQIPERSLQTVFLHELGHALGLFGHSDSPQDIMYSSDLTGGKGKANQAVVTFRDLNTLKKVYETPQQASTLTTPKPLEWGAGLGEEANSH